MFSKHLIIWNIRAKLCFWPDLLQFFQAYNFLAWSANSASLWKILLSTWYLDQVDRSKDSLPVSVIYPNTITIVSSKTAGWGSPLLLGHAAALHDKFQSPNTHIHVATILNIKRRVSQIYNTTKKILLIKRGWQFYA